MSDYTITKDREFGFLTTFQPSSPSSNRNSETTELQISAVDILEIFKTVKADLKGLRVLDIGCRDGNFLAECRKCGMVCDGWENIQAWSDKATARGFSVSNQDLTVFLSRTDVDRFDVVNLMNVLQHIKNPAKVLNDVRNNMLAEKGIAIVGVPNTFGPLQRVAAAELALGEWWVKPGAALNYFTSETLIDLLEGCAYSVIKDLSSAFGRLGLGDNIIVIARPDAFSKPYKSKKVTNREK